MTTSEQRATVDGRAAPSRPRARRRPIEHRAALAQLLGNASYEVLPFKSTEAAVLEHVPTSLRLNVVTTEAKGFGATLTLAERLARQGYDVSPHLAARNVRDEAELTDIVARLDDAGVKGIFLIGGDAAKPAGTYTDAWGVLEALERIGHRFERIGIAGYPEGHGQISAELIERALERKAPYATHIISQLCFQPAATVGWARQLVARGVDLPVVVGLPGEVNRQKLVRISASLGLGQSARFLQKQSGMFWRFFLPGGYSPDRLIEQLAPHVGRADNRVTGIHFFTFNEVAKTEQWRQAWLARLS